MLKYVCIYVGLYVGKVDFAKVRDVSFIRRLYIQQGFYNFFSLEIRAENWLPCPCRDWQI